MKICRKPYNYRGSVSWECGSVGSYLSNNLLTDRWSLCFKEGDISFRFLSLRFPRGFVIDNRRLVFIVAYNSVIGNSHRPSSEKG